MGIWVRGRCVAAVAIVLAGHCMEAVAADSGANAIPTLGEVVVSASQPAVDPDLPAVSEGVTAQTVADTVNIVNTEDAVKYLPSVQIRKRYIGDRNSIIVTRTSGSISSARSLVYADGLLLSNLLGNGWNFAPRWDMVSPEEIKRVDVIYGPFSAAYPGNSMGATVLITTRMPEKFEAHAKAQEFWQHYRLYGTDDDYAGRQFNALLGNRQGNVAWFASFDHLDSHGQPMTFATKPASTTAAGGGDTVVSGAYHDTDANGNPRVVMGATSIDHTVQDTAKLKLAVDLTPTLRAAYTLGYWQDDSDVSVQSYLRDASGNPVYSGNVAIDGYHYALPTNLFLPSRRQEAHWLHGLSLISDTGGAWDWQAIATWYHISQDEKRSPSTALPAAQGGGAGRIALGDGTGWRTLDLKGQWRPGGSDGAHRVAFGYHDDHYFLDSRVFNTGDWLSGGPTTRVSAFAGDTETQALFAQDAWRFAPAWTLILGGRYEYWRAFDGALSNAATTLGYPTRRDHFFSPKASLVFQATPVWRLRASLGRAYRLPTVSELFQGSISSGTIVNNDPNLKPEKATSGELTAERSLRNGLLRLSVFQEDTVDALYKQTDITVFPTVTNIQNIGKIRSRGAEVAYQGQDIAWRGLDVSGSVTYVDSVVLKNDQFPASVGKKQVRVPDWRATAVATYHQNARLSYTLAARYSGRQYNTLDNTDSNPDTYGGTSRFFVVDAKVNYTLAKHATVSVGVNNLNNYRYYAYHPYPQRTVFATLRFDY